MPGIEVGPDHHHLVLEVAAGNFADDVLSRIRLLPDPVSHLDPYLHRDLALRVAVQPVVMLRRDDHHHR